MPLSKGTHFLRCCSVQRRWVEKERVKIGIPNLWNVVVVWMMLPYNICEKVDCEWEAAWRVMQEADIMEKVMWRGRYHGQGYAQRRDAFSYLNALEHLSSRKIIMAGEMLDDATRHWNCLTVHHRQQRSLLHGHWPTFWVEESLILYPSHNTLRWYSEVAIIAGSDEDARVCLLQVEVNIAAGKESHRCYEYEYVLDLNWLRLPPIVGATM